MALSKARLRALPQSGQKLVGGTADLANDSDRSVNLVLDGQVL